MRWSLLVNVQAKLRAKLDNKEIGQANKSKNDDGKDMQEVELHIEKEVAPKPSCCSML